MPEHPRGTNSFQIQVGCAPGGKGVGIPNVTFVVPRLQCRGLEVLTCGERGAARVPHCHTHAALDREALPPALPSKSKD